MATLTSVWCFGEGPLFVFSPQPLIILCPEAGGWLALCNPCYLELLSTDLGKETELMYRLYTPSPSLLTRSLQIMLTFKELLL